MTKIKLIILVVLASLVLTACGAGQPTPAPTLDPIQIQQTVGAIQTQAVQEAWMQMTQTALAMPSATPTITPTNTPEVTNTPAASATPLVLVPIVPTAGYVPPAVVVPTVTNTPSMLSCSIISISPANNSTFPKNQDVDMMVKVKNTGTITWDQALVDMHFADGDQMVESEWYDFPESVAPGKDADVWMDVKTGSVDKTYKMTFEVLVNGTQACTFSVTYIVD